MNNLNNSESDRMILNETLECLNKTFSEKNNAERANAEKRLKELESNFIQHFQILLLSMTSSQLNQDTKLSAIIYLKNILRARIDSRTLTPEDSKSIIQAFIELILTGNLNDQLLQNLNLSLSILFNTKYITEEGNLVVSVCSYLLDFLRREMMDTEKIQISKPVVILLQNIISSTCTNLDNIYEVLQKQFESIDVLIYFITMKLKTLTLKDDPPVYLSW
jgi:hypothetical protein